MDLGSGFWVCLRMCPVLQLPDLKDAEAVQKFFLEEIQQGEELLAQGEAVCVYECV